MRCVEKINDLSFFLSFRSKGYLMLTFSNSYVLWLLRCVQLRLVTVTFCDVNVVWCYVLSQYPARYMIRFEIKTWVEVQVQKFFHRYTYGHCNLTPRIVSTWTWTDGIMYMERLCFITTIRGITDKPAVWISMPVVHQQSGFVATNVHWLCNPQSGIMVAIILRTVIRQGSAANLCNPVNSATHRQDMLLFYHEEW